MATCCVCGMEVQAMTQTTRNHVLSFSEFFSSKIQSGIDPTGSISALLLCSRKKGMAVLPPGSMSLTSEYCFLPAIPSVLRSLWRPLEERWYMSCALRSDRHYLLLDGQSQVVPISIKCTGWVSILHSPWYTHMFYERTEKKPSSFLNHWKYEISKIAWKWFLNGGHFFRKD